MMFTFENDGFLSRDSVVNLEKKRTLTNQEICIFSKKYFGILLLVPRLAFISNMKSLNFLEACISLDSGSFPLTYCLAPHVYVELLPVGEILLKMKKYKKI